MKAKLPLTEGTWPAFWLLDVPSFVTPGMNSHEIDILEQYSTVQMIHSTLHWWDAKNSTGSWGLEGTSIQCAMTEGFHTYGLDLQPDFLTFYFDRNMIWFPFLLFFASFLLFLCSNILF